jgi:prepilin-type processing-associated H-X9-DG protein
MSPRAKGWLIGGGAGVLLLVLVLVMIPASDGGDGLRTRASCARNLKYLGTSLAIYAVQFNDQLPVDSATFAGTWMTDQSAMCNGYTAISPPPSGSFDPRSVFYCPSNRGQDLATLWGGPAAPYRITGYVWTNERPGMPNLAGLRPNPPLEYHEKFAWTRQTSESELAADWIISDTNQAKGARWNGITAAGRPGTYDTSHMSGNMPAGANCLMFDGHYEWRRFNPATATAVPQGAGGPSFWFAGP